MPIEMLNWRLMPPGNIVYRNTQRGRHLLSLGWAGRPAAEDDGERAALFQLRAIRQLGHGQFVLMTQFSDAARHDLALSRTMNPTANAHFKRTFAAPR